MRSSAPRKHGERTDWNQENWCRCGSYITRNNSEPWLDAGGHNVIALMGQQHKHEAKYELREAIRNRCRCCKGSGERAAAHA